MIKCKKMPLRRRRWPPGSSVRSAERRVGDEIHQEPPEELR